MRDQVKSVGLRLGRNVQQFRRLRGFSQETLAERASTSRKEIWLVEQGKVNVTLDLVTRIAASLRVEVSELFESEYDRPTMAPFPVQDLEPLERLLKSLERVKKSRFPASRPRRR